MRPLLEEAVAKFNAKVEKDPGLQRELEGMERKVLIEVKEGPRYHFVLKDQRVDGVRDGPIESPDVTIIGDEATLTGLLKGELGPMRALATNRLKVKGSLEDILRIRKFF